MRVIESGFNTGASGTPDLDLQEDKRYVFMFRHGETNWNVEKKIKGHLADGETYFTEKGQQQIEGIAVDIIHYNIEAIFSSDLSRTRDTAEIVKERTGLDVTYTKELEGLNTGIFQGKSFEEFHKDPVAIRSLTDYSIPFPEGESINDLVGRFIAFIYNTMEQYPYKRIALISHGAAISNVRASLLQIPFEDIDRCVIEYS